MVVARGASAEQALKDAVDAGGSTPAVLVRHPATPRQSRMPSTLQQLAGAVTNLEPDDLLIFGREVAEMPLLDWFERRPLFGLRVVVTRPREQARQLIEDLQAEGADVLAIPLIRIDPPEDREPLRRCAERPDQFDWIVFTSANGVERFWEELEAAGRDSRALGGVAVCAIGPATGEALSRHGVRVDLVPEEFVAESAVAALAAAEPRGKRVLLPRAEIARSVLPDSLRAMGAEVTEVAAYRTVPDEDGIRALKEALASGHVDVLTFTSSSTARNFAELVDPDVGSVRIASIGPITSATVRELGWEVAVEAPVHTAEGLKEALVAYYAPEQGRAH